MWVRRVCPIRRRHRAISALRELNLKVGTIVMLLRNMNEALGLLNGVTLNCEEHVHKCAGSGNNNWGGVRTKDITPTSRPVTSGFYHTILIQN